MILCFLCVIDAHLFCFVLLCELHHCLSRCLLYSYFTPLVLLLVVMMKMSEANSNQVILSTIYMKVTAVILPLSAGKLKCMIISSFSFFSVLLTGTSLAKDVWKQSPFSPPVISSEIRPSVLVFVEWYQG